MPTNLKTLLSRSRSKNDLKLRESKDEISSPVDTSASTCDTASCGKCDSSGPNSGKKVGASSIENSDSSFYNVSKAGLHQRDGNDSEPNCFPVLNADFNYNSNHKSDESPESGFVAKNFRYNSASESASGTSMMSGGKCFQTGSTSHNMHKGRRAYQCGNQNYAPYDLPTGYYLDEKSSVACNSRFAGMMDHRDRGEIRRNASCKTLFFSCGSGTLHPPCSSYEPSHMETTSECSPSCESHPSIGTSNGNVAAVPTSVRMPAFSQTRTNVADACGSSSYGSPSTACRTFNVKDGSPCQSLSMRKCETVLALSNFNGNMSTNAAPVPSTNSYVRNTAAGSGTYSNFPASGTTGGGPHLSSSTNSNNVGGKVKVMKDKIFSTSSSALNCLLHSSSRTGKLFYGWKLNSNNNSSNTGSNTNMGHISSMYGGSSEANNCLGATCQQNKLFVGTSGISSSPATTSDNNKLGSTAPDSVIGHHHKSRSQLSISENNFTSPAPLTPVNRLRRNVSVNNTSSFCVASGNLSAHSSYSRSSSVASFGWKEKEDTLEQSLLCRLCLCNVGVEDTMEILACSCRYCKDCLIQYVSFEIQQAADEIACPDASCEKQGVLGLAELEHLVPALMEKHRKFRLFREVEKDSNLMWCPSPGCETVCQIQDGSILTGGFVTENDRTRGNAAGASRTLPLINCPTCRKTHCAECKLSWHPDSSCESFRRKLIKQGKLSSEDDELFSLDSIKKCPFCHVPIEKDSGCAQMMCKRCKHVFCWYCLASLDDDFLLRHYDKGPCKNKLGHSRASVVWHRAQVIGIFAGFGVLVLLASPLLILAAPCLLCCRCRYCANKLDPDESPVPV